MQGESYLPHLLSVANYFLKNMLTPCVCQEIYCENDYLRV